MRILQLLVLLGCFCWGAALPSVAQAQGKTVVKPDEFWTRLQFSGTVKQVFEGDFSSVNTVQFKIYYRGLQVAYSDLCRNELPKNTVRRGYVSQVVHGDGYRETPEEHFAYIDPRFVAKYDAYEKEATAFLLKTFKNQTNAAMTDFARGGSNLGSILMSSASNAPGTQMARFINATGCKTAALYQLRENYGRAAHGKTSLQQDNVQLKNATKESAPAERTMYGACTAKDKSWSKKKYCLCFEEKAKTIMTADEYAYYKEDYSRYSKDVLRKIRENRQLPVGDRAWRLNDIRNACAR